MTSPTPRTSRLADWWRRVTARPGDDRAPVPVRDATLATDDRAEATAVRRATSTTSRTDSAHITLPGPGPTRATSVPAGPEPQDRNAPVWEVAAPTAEGLHLPPLAESVHADLCVIGLGGSGLAAVTAALDRGLSVVGVDAGPIAGRAAGRNGGFLLAGTALFHHDAVRRFGRDRALAWHAATLAEIDRLVAEDDQVRRVGSLRVAVDDTEFADIERQLAVMADDDLPVEPYEGPEGRGLLIPTDAAMNPLTRCRRLARRALAAGARLYADSPARTVSGRRVTTTDGTVQCDQVVVAVDGTMGSILPELAGRVRPVRLQMLGTDPTDEVTLPRPVYARYGLDYWSQQPDGRIALGGGRDHGADEEEGARPEPSSTVQGHLDDLLRTGLGVTAPVTHRWAATVGFTATGLPVCQQVRPGVWAVGGYNGTGNVIGAMLARVAVDLAHGSSDLADELFET